MRLELTWPDRIVGSLVAVASMIALFMFSTRDEGDAAGNTLLLLERVFSACWLAAILTLVFHAQKARENRIRRRESSNRRSRDASAAQAAAAIAVGVAVRPDTSERITISLADRVTLRRNCVVSNAAQAAAPITPAVEGEEPHRQAALAVAELPRTWSCLVISVSCLSYTTPQAIRLALPRYEALRGVTGQLSNLCFVAHLLMLANKGASSARKRSVVHLAVQGFGIVCHFGAELRRMGFTVGLALNSVFSVGGTVLELWLLTRIMLPTLASRNPTLHAELPIKVFQWLFQRGGLTMAMYCYFEAFGIGFSDGTAEDVRPWLDANNTVLLHLTFSAALSLTLLADSRTSLSAVLRGLAPLYEKVGLTIVFVTSLIPLAMFAGREWCDRQQQPLYSVASTSTSLLWAVAVGVLAAGHTLHLNNSKNNQALTAPVGGSSGEEEGGNEQDRAASFSAVSGGGALTVGI